MAVDALSNAGPAVRRILVCDDEARVVEVTTELLRSLGFDAVGETSCEQTVTRFERGERPDALLLDANFAAGMSAQELLLRIGATGSSLPVILTSGSLLEDIAPALVQHPMVSAYLPKPYSAKQLADTMNQCLETPGKRVDNSDARDQ